ncbi:hypothetical protein LTR66_013395 [Elasticomyces elasticus]|nr:hypothetical protein LTR66_013395 [Elasticomyces elasticus]
MLREYIDYFGPKTEQLDVCVKDGKAVFTSFTEKIMNGKEILKHPLETAIAINVHDFDQFKMEDDLHITSSVKDFKAIVMHAETLRTTITASFSRPSRPLRYSYQAEGVHVEFTLMTSGSYTGSATPTPALLVGAKEDLRRSSAASTGAASRLASEMPPPNRPRLGTAQNQAKALSLPSQESAEPTKVDRNQASDSLFISQDEDDRRWDPPEIAEENDEMLGWDASADNVGMSPNMNENLADDAQDAGFHPTFRDSNTLMPTHGSQGPQIESPGLPPTQRVSQVRGIFD